MRNGLIIDTEGNRRYYLNDKLHRVDGPAEELISINWNLYNQDTPAEEWPDRREFWWLDGKRHRECGPAMVFPCGRQYWFLNDEELIQPKEFNTLDDWFHKLNNDEKYSLPYINGINGIIGFIKEPTGKQTRLHAMRWKI